MNFDHSDYLVHSGKYRLFKTATLRNTIIHENGHVDAGTIVSLEWLGDVYNALYRRTEPIYRLNTGDTVFAANLREFTL